MKTLVSSFHQSFNNGDVALGKFLELAKAFDYFYRSIVLKMLEFCNSIPAYNKQLSVI